MKWLRRLNLSPRTQRALDEALLDWRHESSSEDSTHRMGAHVRHSVAVLRTCVLAAADEAREFVPNYWSAAIPIVLLLIVGVPWLSTIDAQFFNYPSAESFALVSLCSNLTRALPVAAFLTIVGARRDRPAPILGIMLSLSAAALFMTIIAWPMAWRHYAEVGLRRPGFFPSVPIVEMAPSLIARIVAAALLADRIRVDSRRIWLLAAAFMAVAVVDGHYMFKLMRSDFIRAGWSGSSAWHFLLLPLPIATRAARLLVDMFPLPILSVALWYGLVKRQERMALVTPPAYGPAGPSLRVSPADNNPAE
jgi:hypothetical protein